MIAGHEVDAVPAAELAERLDVVVELLDAAIHQVAGHHDKIGIQGIHTRREPRRETAVEYGSDMDVADLGDPEAVESGRPARDRHLDAAHAGYAKPAPKPLNHRQRDGRCHEGRAQPIAGFRRARRPHQPADGVGDDPSREREPEDAHPARHGERDPAPPRQRKPTLRKGQAEEAQEAEHDQSRTQRRYGLGPGGIQEEALGHVPVGAADHTECQHQPDDDPSDASGPAAGGGGRGHQGIVAGDSASTNSARYELWRLRVLATTSRADRSPRNPPPGRRMPGRAARAWPWWDPRGRASPGSGRPLRGPARGRR